MFFCVFSENLTSSKAVFTREGCKEVELEADFNILFTKIQESLDRQGITADKLVSFLERFPAIATSDKSLFYEILPRLKKQEKLNHVFDEITEYCSWFNHSLIDHIFDVYCDTDESVKETYDNYCTKLKQYCEQRICRCSELVKKVSRLKFGRKKDGVRLTVTINQEWSTVTVGQLEVSIHALEEVLSVHRQVLYLCSAEEGSVKLTFLVPAFVAEALFPLSPEQETALCQKGIMQLHVCCSDYCNRLSQFQLGGKVHIHVCISDDCMYNYKIP